MKTGINEIQAKKWPILSPLGYRTWVNVMAFNDGTGIGLYSIVKFFN